MQQLQRAQQIKHSVTGLTHKVFFGLDAEDVTMITPGGSDRGFGSAHKVPLHKAALVRLGMVHQSK